MRRYAHGNILYKTLTAQLVLLILIAIPLIVRAGATDTAKGHILSMMEAGKQMMSHGEQGHWDLMVRQAEAMREHARAVLQALPPDHGQSREAVGHLKEAIGHLEELIARRTKSHGELLMAHAKKAMSHAGRAAKHVQ